MISAAELDSIAGARIEDAEALLHAGRFDGEFGQAAAARVRLEHGGPDRIAEPIRPAAAVGG